MGRRILRLPKHLKERGHGVLKSPLVEGIPVALLVGYGLYGSTHGESMATLLGSYATLSLLSALFSSSETALTAHSQQPFEKEKFFKEENVPIVLKGILGGNTLANLFLGGVSFAIANRLIGMGYNISESLLTLFTTAFIFYMGEAIPKIMALSYPNSWVRMKLVKSALAFSYLLGKVVDPVLKPGERLGRLIASKMFGDEKRAIKEEIWEHISKYFSPFFISTAKNLDKMVHTPTKELMIPLKKVLFAEENERVDEVNERASKVFGTTFTRIPVFKAGASERVQRWGRIPKDYLVGIFHQKDLANIGGNGGMAIGEVVKKVSRLKKFIRVDEPLQEALARIKREEGIIPKLLFVVDGGDIIGIVLPSDLLDYSLGTVEKQDMVIHSKVYTGTFYNFYNTTGNANPSINPDTTNDKASS